MKRVWKRHAKGWIECGSWRITYTPNVPCGYLLWDLRARPYQRLVAGFPTETEAREAARERERSAA